MLSDVKGHSSLSLYTSPKMTHLLSPTNKVRPVYADDGTPVHTLTALLNVPCFSF